MFPRSRFTAFYIDDRSFIVYYGKYTSVVA